MAAGLRSGSASASTDTVFRRSFSALVLAECIERDTARPLVPRRQDPRVGRRVATWLLRERDLRGYVPGQGLGARGRPRGRRARRARRAPRTSAHAELTVLLDVIADRLLLPVDRLFAHGEHDRLAPATDARCCAATLVPLDVLEPWIDRLGAGAPARVGHDDGTDPYLDTGNAAGVPARALPAARARHRAARGPGRPAARPGRRAARDQPALPPRGPRADPTGR